MFGLSSEFSAYRHKLQICKYDGKSVREFSEGTCCIFRQDHQNSIGRWRNDWPSCWQVSGTDSSWNIRLSSATCQPHRKRLYHSLTTNPEWMNDLRAADAIFVVTHSQGSVVSTHLLNRLIHDRHIHTAKTASGFDLRSSLTGEAGVQVASTCNPQKICCLALCGIHLGPLRYLRNSNFVQPYLHVRSNLFPTHDLENDHFSTSSRTLPASYLSSRYPTLPRICFSD